MAVEHFDELTFHMVTGEKPESSLWRRGPEGAVQRFAGIRGNARRGVAAEAGQGFSPKSGPALTVTPEGITAGLTVALPSIALGVLSFQNIAVSAALSLYFTGLPARMRFGLSTRENPFLISYSIFGGGGYLALSVDTAGELAVEASLEFGAVVTLSLVVATGTVQAMAGIRFTMSPGVELAGYVATFRLPRGYGGSSRISVCFLLELRYNETHKTATGRAVLVVMVRVLAFSKSVTLEVERSFSTDVAPRSFAENVSIEQWTEYCTSFA